MKQLLCFLVAVWVTTFGDALEQCIKEPNCARLSFDTLAKKCCVQPLDSPLVESTACKPPLGATVASALNWANKYKINELQTNNNVMTNIIDVGDTKTNRDLCNYGAFMACVFKEKRWLETNGDIKIKSLKSQIQSLDSANPTYWNSTINLMLDRINHKLQPFEAINFREMVNDRFERITCKNEEVNLLPLMMAQMIQSELIWMCPQQIKYSKENNCKQLMEQYQFCDAGKIYSTNEYEGVFSFPAV